MRILLKISVLTSLTALVIATAWLLGWKWLTVGRFEEATDNAYVRTDITSIAPKVAGYVVSVNVGDNGSVAAGEVLFQIDDRDFRARLLQADALVASTRAAIQNLEAQKRLQVAVIAQSQAQLESAQAGQTLAIQDFERYRSLVQKNAVSEAQFDQKRAARVQATAAVNAAQAAIKAQHRKLDVLAAQREAAYAAWAQAVAARTLAQIDLENTTVRTPVDGVVGNRQVRLGRFVTAGTSVLDIVPVQHIWIVANFKETQLENIRVGQPAQVSIDGYPHAEIQGVVDSLAPGSGATFSLIPADNATGNFVRVVQRVPVKIRLTNMPSHLHLVPGLSARVSIRTAGEDASS